MTATENERDQLSIKEAAAGTGITHWTPWEKIDHSKHKKCTRQCVRPEKRDIQRPLPGAGKNYTRSSSLSFH